MKNSIVTITLLASILLAIAPLAANAQYGGGGGPPVGLFGISFNSSHSGKVLGASTSTIPSTTSISCSALLTSYMRIGMKNNSSQVTLLQIFLKTQGYAVSVTGVFDSATLAGVNQFQIDHAADVLAPWGITQATGFVYETTLHEINKLSCPTYVVALPKLVPFI
jgi:hypothetical protein